MPAKRRRKRAGLVVLRWLLGALSPPARGGALVGHREQTHGGKPLVGVWGCARRFGFGAFRSWQSGFVSISLLVSHSIFLRQQPSPQSKPADAARSETGK